MTGGSDRRRDTGLDRLMKRVDRWFWFTVPVFAGRFSMGLAGILGDGRYLAGRRRLGAAVPLAAVLVGFLIGALHPFAEYTNGAVTESLFGLCVLAFLAGLGAAVGLWAFLGLVAGDFLLGYRGFGGQFALVTGFGRIHQQLIPLAILYGVFFVLMVLIPAIVQWISLDFQQRASTRLRSTIARLSSCLLFGLLVYAWAQAAAFLIRPIWSFQGGVPSVTAITNLQLGWWVLAAGAVGGRAIRSALERFPQVVPAQPVDTASAMPRYFALPWWASAGIKATVFSLILGGLVDSLLLGLATWAVLFSMFVVLERLAVSQPALVRRIRGWPLVIRLLIPASLSVGLGLWVAAIAQASYVTTFIPFLASTLVTLFVFGILVPPPSRRSR